MRDPVHWLVDRLAGRIALEVWRQPSLHYAAIASLAQRYGYAALSAAELKVFSQNGEDGVLAEIFSRIETTNRFFVEFGVSNGIECNTRFLMEVLGWSGVYFEPVPEVFTRLSERFASRTDVLAIQAFLTPENASDLFAQAGVPPEPDLLSIDIDGQDYWVWEVLEAYRPRVVVIEYNAKLVGARLVERKGSVHGRIDFGASLEALRALGDRKGYTLVHAELAGVNLFFVRKELAGPFEVPLARGENFELRGYQHKAGDGDYVEV
jgi:hypothetical protein